MARWHRIGSCLWRDQELMIVAGRADNDEKKIAQTLNLIVLGLNNSVVNDELLKACRSALSDAEAGECSDGHTIDLLKAAVLKAEGFLP